jgi:hypothetical protein
MSDDSLKQLKDKCLSLKLPTYGTKAVLKRRIENATATATTVTTTTTARKSTKRKVTEAGTEHLSSNNRNNNIEPTCTNEISFSKMKVDELKDNCKRLKLGTYGTKRDLIDRLQKHQSVEEQENEQQGEQQDEENEQQNDSYVIRDAPVYIEENNVNSNDGYRDKADKKTRGSRLDYVADVSFVLEDEDLCSPVLFHFSSVIHHQIRSNSAK